MSMCVVGKVGWRLCECWDDWLMGMLGVNITLFISITVLCGFDSTLQNAPHNQFGCGKYFAEIMSVP